MLVKRHPFLLIIPLCLVVFFLFDYLPLNGTEKSILVIVSTGIYFLMRKVAIAAFIGNRTKADTFFFFLIVLYAGLASVAHPLFFTEYPVQQVAVKIVFLLLFCGWLSFV